jgi:hypothetical protein
MTLALVYNLSDVLRHLKINIICIFFSSKIMMTSSSVISDKMKFSNHWLSYDTTGLI